MMDDHLFTPEGPAHKNAESAHKAVMAFLSFVGTYAGVLIADASDAAGWVNQVVVVAGGAIGTALTYWTKNRPKF